FVPASGPTRRNNECAEKPAAYVERNPHHRGRGNSLQQSLVLLALGDRPDRLRRDICDHLRPLRLKNRVTQVWAATVQWKPLQRFGNSRLGRICARHLEPTDLASLIDELDEAEV